jgi:hypothetical protein
MEIIVSPFKRHLTFAMLPGKNCDNFALRFVSVVAKFQGLASQRA